MPIDPLTGLETGGAMQPTSPTTSVPTNPANQGPKAWTYDDLAALYKIYDPGKESDINRITKTLGSGPWTADQLKGGNFGGLSSRSMDVWGKALAALGGAASAPSPSSAPTPTPTTPSLPTPTYPPELQQLIVNGQTRGRSYNSQTRQWEETSQSPELIYWGPTNQYYYKGRPITQEQMIQLYTQGPTAIPGQGLDAYTTPTGPIEGMLANLLRQGSGAFSTQPGPVEQALTALLRGSGLTPPAGPVEQRLAGVPGPASYLPPASMGELATVLAFGDPTLTAYAGGQLPPAIQQQFYRLMDESNANILEDMSVDGLRFSTPAVEKLSRTNADAVTNLLAEVERQALAAQQLRGQLTGQAGELANARSGQAAGLYSALTPAALDADIRRKLGGIAAQQGLGLGLLNNEAGRQSDSLSRFLALAGTLYGGEQGRNQGALQGLINEYMNNSGLPSELQGLLGLLGTGGGTQTQTQGGGGNSLFPQLLQAGLMAAMMFGPCWVAAELYGKTWNFAHAFAWINFGWQGKDADRFRSFYRAGGPGLARAIRTDQRLRDRVHPFFDDAVKKGAAWISSLR